MPKFDESVEYLDALTLDHVVIDPDEAKIYKSLGISGKEVYLENKRQKEFQARASVSEDEIYAKLGLTRAEVDQVLAGHES